MGVINVPIPDEIEDDFREAIAQLALALTRSGAAAVRLAVGEACRSRGIPCPSDEALIGPPPGPRPVKKGAKKKPARKPPR